MPYCLSPDVKVINENALGDLVFLFNSLWIVGSNNTTLLSIFGKSG